MKKRIFSLLLALCLVAGLLPTTALAAVSYGFSINGTSVTSDNINSLPGVTPTDSSKSCSIQYFSTEKILLLNNVTISAGSDVTTVLNCGNLVSRIILSGENVIDGTNISRKDSDVAGIFTTGPLRIESQYNDGKLTITMPRIYTQKNVRGISASSAPITISSCSLDVLCAGAAYTGATNPATNAIYAYNSNITIQDASVCAVIGKDRNGNITNMHGGSAIYAYRRSDKGTLSITNSNVTAGAYSNSTAQNSQHKFTALEGKQVVLTRCALDLTAQVTGQAVPSRAIHTWNDSGTITLTNCSGTLNGSDSGIDIGKDGKNQSASLKIDSCDLTVTGGTHAILLRGTGNKSLTFNNVTVKSGETADSAQEVTDLDNTSSKYWEKKCLLTKVNPVKPTINVTGTYTYTGSSITATVNGYDPKTMNISGNSGVNAGTYTVFVSSQSGKWADNTTGNVTTQWSIEKKTPTAADFTLNPPSNLTYDGSSKTVTATLNSPMTGVGTITPKYYKDSTLVTDTKDAGVYTVKLDVAEGTNFKPATDLTGDGWEFRITPADQPAPIGLGVQAPAGSSSKGSITGTTTAMEYSTDSSFASPAGTACSDGSTEVDAGNTYYVRYKADTNHNAGTASEALIVPAALAFTDNPAYDVPAGYVDTVITEIDVSDAVSGGTAPYTFSKSSGPSWLNASSDGKITGTRPASATAATTAIIQVTDSASPANSKTIEIAVGEVMALPTVTTPVIAPAGGTFFGSQTVAITCETAGAKIYYTTDGTDPATSSTKTEYTALLRLTSTATVKAIAVKEGMTDSAVTSAIFTKYSGGGSTYGITVESAENGDVTASHKTASKGTTVTLTVTPDKGCTLETLTVTDGSGKEIELTDKGDGKYTFTMPASKVTVKATFMEDNSMLNFFVDVPADAYYYDAVLWAAENGITGGVDETHFAPNDPCTRAQAVTFLWRAAGCPAPQSSEMPFTDVAEGSYYYDAVLWAVENGITKGTSDTTFSPDATCSRGQIVTFLWRSLESPDAGGANPFTDVAADDYYADAVLWAVENGITTGTADTTFGPSDDCTRAQIVTFLYRT